MKLAGWKPDGDPSPADRIVYVLDDEIGRWRDLVRDRVACAAMGFGWAVGWVLSLGGGCGSRLHLLAAVRCLQQLRFCFSDCMPLIVRALTTCLPHRALPRLHDSLWCRPSRCTRAPTRPASPSSRGGSTSRSSSACLQTGACWQKTVRVVRCCPCVHAAGVVCACSMPWGEAAADVASFSCLWEPWLQWVSTKGTNAVVGPSNPTALPMGCPFDVQARTSAHRSCCLWTPSGGHCWCGLVSRCSLLFRADCWPVLCRPVLARIMLAAHYKQVVMKTPHGPTSCCALLPVRRRVACPRSSSRATW